MPEREPIQVGILAAPGQAAEQTEALAAELCAALGERYPGYEWHTTVVQERVGSAPVASLVEIVEDARARLLREDWDLALAVTDQPLRVGRRPVPDYASATHRVGAVSLPGLGAVAVRRRLRAALLEQVGELLGEDAGDRHDGHTARIAPATGGEGPLFALSVSAANARLLLAMVRANHPWRFALRLYRVLVTAVATAVFALITAEVWELADAAGWPRLLGASIVAVTAIVGIVIAAHGLWERAPNRRVRQDVILFNLATAVTVAIGVVTLYAVLFAVCLAASLLIIDADVIGGVIGEEAGLTDYLPLAWLLASIATLGGALGAGIESAEAVREAAYAPIDDEDEVPVGDEEARH